MRGKEPSAARLPVLISDGATGQPVTAITAQPYTGPVAGIAQQVVAVTPQSLNILATAPNLFTRTGSGTDAIQAAGGPVASITLAGFTAADLAGGRITASFGRDAASGSDYLHLRAA